MNKQEAIRILGETKLCSPLGQACFVGIEALEKQMPKKIDRVGNKCPVCKCYLASKPIGDNYCFNCGQAISWEE